MENFQQKESDIYSLGIIMWMLSAGARPYWDKPKHLFWIKTRSHLWDFASHLDACSSKKSYQDITNAYKIMNSEIYIHIFKLVGKRY